MYLIAAIGFSSLPQPKPLGWSIREALAYKTKQELESPNKTKVSDSNDRTEFNENFLRLRNGYDSAQDGIIAPVEETQNTTLPEEGDSDIESNCSVTIYLSSTDSSSFGIQDTLPKILPVEEEQLQTEDWDENHLIPDDTAAVTTNDGSILGDGSPASSFSSGSNYKQKRKASAVTFLTEESTDRDDDEADSICGSSAPPSTAPSPSAAYQSGGFRFNKQSTVSAIVNERIATAKARMRDIENKFGRSSAVGTVGV